MKPMIITCAVSVIIACIYVGERAAVPLSESEWRPCQSTMGESRVHPGQLTRPSQDRNTLTALQLLLTKVRLEESVESEAAQNLDQAEAVVLAKETSPEVLFRMKRQSHLSMCRYCCNCCNNASCGYCCRF